MTTLDIDLVRAQFPALSDPELDGSAFFENAGGSFPCRQVIGRLTDYYRRLRVQPHHPHPLGERAGEAMDAGPRRLAAALGVEPDELHVGPSTTQNTYVLAAAFRAVLRTGDAVVVSQQDHEANSGAWRRLADGGVEIRQWPVDPATGRLDAADLEPLLDERVRVVAFPHVSNIVGEDNDVAAICARAHSVGAVAVVDGVAAAPHGLPDLGALGADVYLFSTYKTFGPHQGVMYVRRELLDELPNQGHFFNAGLPGKRLVPAGPDHAQVAALGGIVDYLELLDEHHFDDEVALAERTQRVGRLWHAHESALLASLLDALRDRDGVRIIGPGSVEGRHPTVSIATDRPGAELARELSEHGIMCGGGHFYAWRLLEALGIDPEHGVTRFSFLHNTTEAEVEQLIGALDRVLG